MRGKRIWGKGPFADVGGGGGGDIIILGGTKYQIVAIDNGAQTKYNDVTKWGNPLLYPEKIECWSSGPLIDYYWHFASPLASQIQYLLWQSVPEGAIVTTNGGTFEVRPVLTDFAIVAGGDVGTLSVGAVIASATALAGSNLTVGCPPFSSNLAAFAGSCYGLRARATGDDLLGVFGAAGTGVWRLKYAVGS